MNKYFIDELNKTVSDINSEKTEGELCFGLLTDSMLSDSGDDTRENIKALDNEIELDFLVHLGNIICGNNPERISMELYGKETEKYRNAVKSGRLFVTQGIKDGYRDERFSGQLVLNIMYDELWYENTKYIDEYRGVVRKQGKPYYFVDIKGVRLIFLCSYYSQIDKQNEIYEKHTFIDVEQAAWLKCDALNVPFGTTVLIFSHAIPKSRFETGKDPYIYKGNSTESTLMILQQAQKRGIKVACWFAGAYNYDCEANVGGVNYSVISSQLPQAGTGTELENARVAENRKSGTVNQECFDIVRVNTQKREIKMYRFGCGEDRKFNY